MQGELLQWLVSRLGPTIPSNCFCDRDVSEGVVQHITTCLPAIALVSTHSPRRKRIDMPFPCPCPIRLRHSKIAGKSSAPNVIFNTIGTTKQLLTVSAILRAFGDKD